MFSCFWSWCSKKKNECSNSNEVSNESICANFADKYWEIIKNELKDGLLGSVCNTKFRNDILEDNVRNAQIISLINDKYLKNSNIELKELKRDLFNNARENIKFVAKVCDNPPKYKIF